MVRQRRFICLVVALTLLASCTSGGDSPVSAGLDVLRLAVSAEPGGQPLFVSGVDGLTLYRNVPVNVVTIGFEGVIDEARFADLLPAHNGPMFHYTYQVVHTPAWFDDVFFTVLRSIASPLPPAAYMEGLPAMPITLAQLYYSYCNLPAGSPAGCDFDPAAPRVNPRVIEQGWVIDAKLVEKLLSYNLGPLFGLDTTAPTVVLINWWGRPDYIDHVYLDLDEPDPDTGFPTGALVRNELAGTGGTPADDPESCGPDNPNPCVPHRIWFHDLSAGPFLRPGSWDLVGPEVRTESSWNGVPDYRIHHVADYGLPATSTYRPLDDLTADLAERLVGDVFLGGILGNHPLYPPGLDAPLQPGQVELDINRFQLDPANPFDGLLHPDVLTAKMSKLPAYTFSAEVTDHEIDPHSPLLRVWDCFKTYMDDLRAFGLYQFGGESCYGNRLYGTAFADLYLYFHDHLAQYLEGDAEHEIPIFQFNVSDADVFHFTGVADQTYTLPVKQGFVFTATTAYRNSFLGHTVTLVHEVGHHLGLRHPFHGLRCLDTGCTTIRFGGIDDTYFTWAGAHVGGAMTYIQTGADYNRFERDLIGQFMSDLYLSYSVGVFDALAAHPKKLAKAMDAVNQADQALGIGIGAFQALYYEDAALWMQYAFQTLKDAAEAQHVPLDPRSWQGRLHAPPDQHAAYNEWARQILADHAETLAAPGALALPGMPAPTLETLAFEPATTPISLILPVDAP